MKKHELEHELNVYKKALDLMTNFYCVGSKCYITEQLVREVVDKDDN